MTKLLASEVIKWMKQWEECSICDYMVKEKYCFYDNFNNIICKDCASGESDLNADKRKD